ncbi:MAG: aspartate kinase [Erysipelotrichaceae bacterium]|jgi:aspartate kinase|nr:aspartate kinase [Bacillota bacterium]NLP21602.1 aspartate kinase [Erysipelotrichaceae bacterium]
MIKVVKFGGSSVASATQFKKVKNIIDSDKDRMFIITSACGKSDDEDHKVTDLLYLCHAHIKYGVPYDDLFNMIYNKYMGIKKELNLKVNLEKEFDIIRELMDKEVGVDYLVSRGEYLTAICLAEYLDAQFIDASEVISFNYSGEVNFERSGELLKNKIKKGKKVVIPGFYGALPNGTIKVMSRGGSDISGSILANIVNADVYENWTDVSGLLIADPRIVKNPKTIDYITYSELRELSYMGANVLHDEAIFPVREKNIPINIRNTNKPDHPGTMILSDCSKQDAIKPPHFITGISGKKNFSVITLNKPQISSEVGALRKTLQVFEDFNVSIESVPVGVDSFSVVVSTEGIEKVIYEVISKLKKDLDCDNITVIDKIALIAVVGRGMKNKPGMSGLLFGELGAHNINIRIINQAADEIDIIIGVENKDFEKTIRCIYDRFITRSDTL